MVATLEGGVIYSAEKDDELFVIIDQSALSDFLNEADEKEIGCFMSIYKFVNEGERKSFINKYKIKILETDGL